MAHAAPVKGYEALQVTVSGRGTIAMRPGEQKTMTIGFQNIGTTTWANNGSGFVSVYTQDPKYRTSVFQDVSWLKADQPARLTESQVKPGEVGHIEFRLHAPSQLGTYRETFQLASEDTAWIPGGKISFSLQVINTISETSNQNTSKTTSTDGYLASILLKSAKTIKTEPGKVVSYTTGIKNAGTKNWGTRTVRTPDVAIATSTSNYRYTSWVNDTTLVAKADAFVTPGQMDLISFQFRAPSKKGKYTVQFVFAADNVPVPGGEIDIPVEVTSDAPDVKDQPVTTKETKKKKTKEQKQEESAVQIEEPTIRVGVLIVDEETENKVRVTCEDNFDVQDGEGHLLAEMNTGKEVEAYYKDGKYFYNRGKGVETSSFYLRFVPKEKNAVCTVTNFDRRVTRNAGYADNTFRNILELRYNKAKDRVWLINELPMEMYLRGLAETSNISHINFQKALITAARTYAFYHWQRATKHADEYFHVDAYADQVYKGYGQEERTPNLTRAVEESKGTIVTYDGKTAITPYFSRSDGRTRSWNEVWYGDVKWLQSVPTPCDEGKTLWGHGVGMSASQALCMANQGKDWKDILTYFYTDIDLQKWW
ncbi:MAG: Curculin domain protein (Mannose-binding) lectin [Candidatus Uhrbacteria bacterium GW2011_GWF2_41_16]|uniref:Curculin domain protein (Mannose-binding) lectin n=2 Tax=Candidatus Uhriibacteriota TaxID=1752732 RepID=A0A0G0V9R5_9BACT|nr:MAG: Curculin domain protein (Mannose-binding) lectin [Candidatus Uhrbacteria bacterium GW2011_GWC2_41_11]KKR97758.1 MAG: Curculin domain protein (Mannose-binding) lectin [Candidatus Uhrbacteria bacterium GW2011_GWF2_41_16]